MIDMAPHITFYGRCREALEFYTSCLQGQVRNCITFGEAKLAIKEGYSDKILTAFFEAQGLMFYASDGFPGQPIAVESNIVLQIESFDEDELKYIYSRFKDGGKEMVSLKNMQDGILYGALRDKYGVNWMFLGLN
jgi:PhnB protein